MTVLNIKPIAWAFSLITLGTEMLNSVFSFYYVKLFLHLYKVSEVAFYQAQMILMIWNALNNLTGYFHNNSKADCCSSRRRSVLYGAPLYTAAFLLPWSAWKYYHEGDWLSGLQLVVSLCAFDSTLTFVQQAQCVLFAEIFTRYESRLQLITINQVASLVGSTSILFCGLISDNMEILLDFQVVAVIVAILATASLYTGTCHISHLEPKRSPEENHLSETVQDLPWTSVVSLMRQILTQKNFRLFLIVNFFQVFHLTFFSNFMMIFVDNLIPMDVLPSSIRSIMYGAGFICPQPDNYLREKDLPNEKREAQRPLKLRTLRFCHGLFSRGYQIEYQFGFIDIVPVPCVITQSWLRKFGYYKIILFSFYLEGTASIVMLLLGQQYYYFLALYLTVIMVIVQASFCLFNLPLADMVDADLLKFNRQSPLSSMVFGINALFTKPAQSLAPMVILSRLNQFGYGNANKSTILDLHDAMFNLICLVPLGIAAIQILVWSPFSIRKKTDYTGAF